MHKKESLAIINMLLFINSYAMEIIQHDTPTINRDLFSTLPNTVRQNITISLLNQTDVFDKVDIVNTYKEIKNIIMSIGMVSKKSYEQTKCPFFMRTIVTLIAEKNNAPHEVVAKLLHTQGATNYLALSKQLYLTTIKNEPLYTQKLAIKKLLSQGADINFQAMPLGSTALSKSIENNNHKTVRFLIDNGAAITTTNYYQSLRDQSMLHSSVRIDVLSQLEELFLHLSIIDAVLQQKEYSRHIINNKLYNNHYAKTVRNCLKIDLYLKSLGIPSRKNLYTDILRPIYKLIPRSSAIIDIITNKHHKYCIIDYR